MSYKLLGRVERKVHIVRNERSAMVPQKSAYCEAWSSTPGAVSYTHLTLPTNSRV